MTLKKEIEFNNIVNDILKNKEFIALKYEIHHGISRLDHSLNVAKVTYQTCKKLKIKNYEEITRAALLHDFFKNDEVNDKAFLNHPGKALKNAQENFNLTPKQENIIAAHMFPMSRVMPTNIGSWVVSSADKFVALYECAKFKAPIKVGATFIFILNLCFIQR